MWRASSDPAGLRQLGQPTSHRREDCAAGLWPEPPALGVWTAESSAQKHTHGLCLLEVVCKSVFRQSRGLESENMISLLSDCLDSFLWYFHAVFLMCCYACVSVLRMFNSHENMN